MIFLDTTRFDIEPLLTSRTTTSNHSGFWDDMEEEGSGVAGKEMAAEGEESTLPRALERVFCWLEEVEAGQQVSGR